MWHRLLRWFGWEVVDAPRCVRCNGGEEPRLGPLMPTHDGRLEHWRCIPAYVRFLGGPLALYLAGDHVVTVEEALACRSRLDGEVNRNAARVMPTPGTVVVASLGTEH